MSVLLLFFFILRQAFGGRGQGLLILTWVVLSVSCRAKDDGKKVQELQGH